MSTYSIIRWQLNSFSSGTRFSHILAHLWNFLYRLLDLLAQEPRWGEGDCCEECMVSVKYFPRSYQIFSIFSGQVWTDDQTSPLPSLWSTAVLQVLCQGDAHHEVQPEQTRQSLWCLLRPAHPRGGGGGQPFLVTTL